MRTRALLCPRNMIKTAGFLEIRSSGKYDVFRIIGTEKDVDLSSYSEVVLLYQYPLGRTSQEFLDFVRRNSIHLKNATLLFDVPMEIMEEIGIERSMEYIRSVTEDVFRNEGLHLSIHYNSNTPVLMDELSEQLDTDIVENTYWKKESGHTAILTTYYLDEIAQPSWHAKTAYMMFGFGMIIVGAILLILRLTDVLPSDASVLISIITVGGISVILTGYYYVTVRNRWKK